MDDDYEEQIQMDKPKSRRRYELRFKEHKVSPRDPKPIGLDLHGDDAERYEEFRLGFTAPVPVSATPEPWPAMPCPYCRSEFSNDKALANHEYHSHFELAAWEGLTFREFLRRRP